MSRKLAAKTWTQECHALRADNPSLAENKLPSQHASLIGGGGTQQAKPFTGSAMASHEAAAKSSRLLKTKVETVSVHLLAKRLRMLHGHRALNFLT